MLAMKEDGQRLIGVSLSPALKHGRHTASSLGEDLDVLPSVVGSGQGDDAIFGLLMPESINNILLLTHLHTMQWPG